MNALLGVAGASSTVIEAIVPYAVAAQKQYLGYAPHGSVHASTVHDFAVTALERAERASDEGTGPALGLAVSAALATNRERRGTNRALIAAATRSGTDDANPTSTAGASPFVQLYELSLEKGARSRGDEDEVVSWAMLHALCRAAVRTRLAAASTFHPTTCSAGHHDFDLVRQFTGALAALTLSVGGGVHGRDLEPPTCPCAFHRQSETPCVGVYAHGPRHTAQRTQSQRCARA